MVLLPCGRCCDTCTCSCVCCECDDGTVWEEAYETFLTVDAAALGDGFGFPAVGDRAFSQSKYAGIVEYLAGCGITRRWSSQSACVDALIAAEKAAIMSAGGPPYTYDLFDAANGYPTTPTATSSLTLVERQRLWAFTTVTSSPSLAHDLLTAAASLADEAAVDAYLADLFDAGSFANLDPTVSLWGYCSNQADILPDGSYWLGWSIPYRDGSPFTLGDLEALCPAGVPYQGGSPPLAWFLPAFANDTEPVIRSVVLASSTGDAVADRLIEIGTRPKSAVADELGDLPDWTKVVTTEAQSCEDIAVESGTKTVTIQVDYESGAVHERWTLIITLSACVNRENDPPDGVAGPHVTAYQFTYDDDPPNNPVSYNDKIASTASIRPYVDEDDCDAERNNSPCAGDLWQVFTSEEAGEQTCCGLRSPE